MGLFQHLFFKLIWAFIWVYWELGFPILSSDMKDSGKYWCSIFKSVGLLWNEALYWLVSIFLKPEGELESNSCLLSSSDALLPLQPVVYRLIQIIHNQAKHPWKSKEFVWCQHCRMWYHKEELKLLWFFMWCWFFALFLSRQCQSSVSAAQMKD